MNHIKSKKQKMSGQQDMLNKKVEIQEVEMKTYNYCIAGRWYRSEVTQQATKVLIKFQSIWV